MCGKTSYKYTEVDIQVPNVVAAHLPDHGLYIATIYRPPSNLLAEDERLIRFLFFSINFVLGKGLFCWETLIYRQLHGVRTWLLVG